VLNYYKTRNHHHTRAQKSQCDNIFSHKADKKEIGRNDSRDGNVPANYQAVMGQMYSSK